jgi:GTP-binding protein
MTRETAAEEARKLFAGEAGFIWASSAIDNLPPEGLPEIAFAGRSNVGKSSLVNALTGRKTLARMSHTPGRTQQLNFFEISDRLRLVDMPGYGFAAVGKQKVAGWTGLIKDYLRGRVSLARVYLLIDARHGLKDLDREILELLDRSAVSYQVILTKADQLRLEEQSARLEEVTAQIAKRPAAYPHVILTSSRDGVGVTDLREAVHKVLVEREG